MSTSKLDEVAIEADRQTEQYLGNSNYHTDADGMRREFGIPAWDADRFEGWKSHVFPNLIEHVWDGPPEGATRDKGGTDMLATGKPGSGKSTWANYLAVRLLEVNNERVVWRGSTSRSEWLPLAPWTKLCLPASARSRLSARLEPKDPRQSPVDDVPLESLAREVEWYDDVRHLNEEILETGKFHVVYPDPQMRGLQAAYEQADEKQYDGLEFSPDDPSKHFWFGFVLDRVENGPFDWTTLILDEVGDVAPQSAQKDDYGTYQKVELLKDSFVDARKTGLSLLLFGHSETDIHDMVRRKIRWRCQMPGSANPTGKSAVVGFDSIPMETDLTSKMKPGELLVYNERNFDDLGYAHLPAPHDYKVKINLG